MDSLATNSELRTTCDTNLLRNLKTGEKLLESGLINMAGVHRFTLLGRSLVLDRPDLSGAAKYPDTPQVGVANLLEIVEAEVLEEREGIVIGVVVVPLKAFGVVEDDVTGQGVVSVNDICQKNHGLATLVRGYGQLGLVVVDDVDVLLPFREIFVKPRDILMLHACHNHLDIVIAKVQRRIVISVFARWRIRGEEVVAEEVDEDDKEDECADSVGAIRPLSRGPMTSHDEMMAVETGS